MIHLVCYLGWHISKSPWRNLVLVCSSLGSTRYASVFLAIYHFHSFLNLISFFWPLTQCPIFCFIFFQRDSSFFFFFLTLALNMQHMEVPRLGVEVELQLLAYITAIATWDPNHICDLYHSSRQRWILNPLSEARDQTCILMESGWVPSPLSHEGNSLKQIFHARTYGSLVLISELVFKNVPYKTLQAWHGLIEKPSPCLQPPGSLLSRHLYTEYRERFLNIWSPYFKI